MPDTPVQSGVCSVCGSAADVATGVCAACTAALGSVIVEPGATMTGATEPFAREPAGIGKFGDYEIIGELARGGMGVVYAAQQISLNRLVALKMILTPFASAKQRQRFQSEAEHAATLEHPNIVPIYDSGLVNGHPYFSMKLVKGRPLSAELRRLILEPRKAVRMLIDVARAVHFAHQRGILHRDLKPANILIDEDGAPYVSDFGVSRRVDAATATLTQEGGIVGTPYYMAPEQAAAKGRVTTSADVYGLGAIMYEMLTLRMPFFDADPANVYHKIQFEDPAPPRKLRRGVDSDLETICLKCLEREPAKRYASAESFARDLERWLKGIPIYARRHSFGERVSKWARRQPAVACSAALAVLLIGALSWSYWHSGEVLRRAEKQKLEERIRFAESAAADGSRALGTARKAADEGRAIDSENALIEAEDHFRAALVSQPGNAAAEGGLRDTALLSFDASLKARNWRQAREKLLLARNAALPEAEFERRQKELERLKSERGNQIRARVTQLMDDAAALTRTVTHEMAVNELIAMKDPMTIELLKGYTTHERAECRTLACAVLAWIGDSSVVATLVPCIYPRMSSRENPPAVQESALIAICRLAANDDMRAFEAVERRIEGEKGSKNSLLFHRIEYYYRDFARRQSRTTMNLSDASSANLLRRALQLSDSGSHKEALAMMDRLLAGDPSDLDLLNHRGLIRWKMKDLAGALKDFNIVVQRLPELKMGYINRAGVLMEMSDPAAALKDFNRAIELAPDDTALLSARGQARIDLDDTAGGMADFDQALKFNPGELYALTNRGHAKAKVKDFRGALADLDRALSINPSFQQALTGRACTRMEMKDIDGAIADFDKTLALNPNQPNCFFNRAILRTAKDEFKDALRDYDRCIALDSSRPVHFYNRGVVKGHLGDAEGAAKDYEKTIAMNPNFVQALINLGVHRMQHGDTKGALELYNRALSINPHKLEGLASRAVLHYREGRAVEAAVDMKAALKVVGDNPEMRAEYEARLAEYERAARKLAKD